MGFSDDATTNRVDLLTAVAGLAGALVIGVAAYEYQRLANHVAQIDGIVSGQSISLARTMESSAAHASDASREIARIDRHEKRLTELETSIHSRPDPFTGTEGRTLERRIDQLELKAQHIGSNSERIALVEENQRSYQAAMIPLIQQSNSLQLQRNQSMK